MGKRVMGELEQANLERALQAQIMAALMRSRRWTPTDIAFQGGTCLSMAYGSPRHSEDLDLLIRSSIDVAVVRKGMMSHLLGGTALSGSARWFMADLTMSVSEGKITKNPFAFNVVLSGPKVIGQVAVKVELFRTDPRLLSELAIRVEPVGGGAVRVPVPVLTLEEIYLGKVMALAARDYVKGRDVFDLEFIRGKLGAIPVDEDGLRRRIAIYEDDACRLHAQALLRIAALPDMLPALRKELQRFLPPIWVLDDASMTTMVGAAAAALMESLPVFEAIASRPSPPTVEMPTVRPSGEDVASTSFPAHAS